MPPSRSPKPTAEPATPPARFGLPHGFRLRGRDVTRLEAFTDAVFAFALTLLVVRLGAVETLGELRDAVQGLIAFGLCFLMFFYVWSTHYAFCRRFGLEDFTTVVLNLALIFVVLFYIYPLRFLARFLTTIFVYGESPGPSLGVQSPSDSAWLMVVYAGGFIAIFGLFGLMYQHALRQKLRLELSAFEIAISRLTRDIQWIAMGVGFVALVLALSPLELAALWSGLSYASLGVLLPGYAVLRARHIPEPAADPSTP